MLRGTRLNLSPCDIGELRERERERRRRRGRKGERERCLFFGTYSTVHALTFKEATSALGSFGCCITTTTLNTTDIGIVTERERSRKRGGGERERERSKEEEREQQKNSGTHSDEFVQMEENEKQRREVSERRRRVRGEVFIRNIWKGVQWMGRDQ